MNTIKNKIKAAIKDEKKGVDDYGKLYRLLRKNKDNYNAQKILMIYYDEQRHEQILKKILGEM